MGQSHNYPYPNSGDRERESMCMQVSEFKRMSKDTTINISVENNFVGLLEI